jgi:hypothetical protein
LKNIVLWEGYPLRSTGVLNLFGLSPPGCQFEGKKILNKLRTPTEDAFFNRIRETSPNLSS